MYAEPHIDRRLPPEAQMDREDALDAFLAVVNTVQPDHPYGDPWPIEAKYVDYGTTRSNYARCGPRRGSTVHVSYDTRMTYINGIARGRHLALLVHEITHIVFGNHGGNQHGGHPPEFWREMAFHALELRDALQDGALDDVFGDVEVEAFLREVAEDPNDYVVDKRYWTVDECQAELRALVGLE